jgi:hypothetical protein
VLGVEPNRVSVPSSFTEYTSMWLAAVTPGKTT